jgi:predicted ribosome quality control (RQC) complex YloA/Tae2 family protein
MLTFQSFNEAVDEYYSKLESQKLLKIALQNEETARKKVEKVKLEQENIIQGLVNQQVKLDKHAKLIELHAEDIDKVLLVINSCIDNGMSWDDIEEMVAMEAQNGNNIAQLIKKLNLNKGKIILALQDDVGEDSDEDSDEEGDVSRKNSPKYDVEIDISLSAYANASIIYTNKKQTHSKEEKTKFISEKVINNVEESTAKQLQQQKIKRNLLAVRKVHWFEKFNWFITSDGYLCISGRDAQQNEALVKRYLRPGDVYVHADIPGAASCIIRCKIPGTADKPASPISPIALQEAGTFAVCRSSWRNHRYRRGN